MSKEVLKLALEALTVLLDEFTPARQAQLKGIEAVTALREALAEQPARPYRQLQDNGSKYFGESWDKAEQPAQHEPEHIVHSNGRYSPLLTRMMNKRVESNIKQVIYLYDKPSPQPAQQEPVAWPAGLIERIKAAEQRIQDGHAPRRIPADPTDVDLVLAEVRYLLEGKQPPFWVHTSPPAQRTWAGLTEQEALDCFSPNPVTHSKNVEAKLKEKNT